MSRDEERVVAPGHDADVEPADPDAPERRQFLSKVGTGLVTAALAAPALMSVRSCVPNALYEIPRRFKAGKPENFADGPTFLADHRVFVFREGETFHCISAVCTHLGCTVQLAQEASTRAGDGLEFHCPCHGSRFGADGTPFDGPAPTPLRYFEMFTAPDDGQLVVDLGLPADKGWRLTL